MLYHILAIGDVVMEPGLRRGRRRRIGGSAAWRNWMPWWGCRNKEEDGMLYHILAIGDVVMEPGLRHLEKRLRPFQKMRDIAFTVVNGENASGTGLTEEQAWRIYDAGADVVTLGNHGLRPFQKMRDIAFTVVNGENASGTGLTEEQAWRIYDAGADVVTLGNHAFGRVQIADFLDDTPWLLRPANFSGRAPGRGCGVYDLGGVRVRVMNLIGRCGLAWSAADPFTTADRLLEQETAEFTLVDFHAEATSEKLALGYYLDGRVSALWGTHTHVPTADERVYPGGTGYQTDLGMTGPVESVLGIRPEQSVEKFLGAPAGRAIRPTWV